MNSDYINFFCIIGNTLRKIQYFRQTFFFSYIGVWFVPRIYSSVLYEADHVSIVKLLLVVSSLRQVLLTPAVPVVSVYHNF